MNQVFRTRNYSIQDIEDWDKKGELVLAPKFQRRDVWNEKARSYLLDTVVKGKPIPKIYMRQEVNPDTRRTKREIVDGQQRLRTVLNYLDDGFPIMKTHNSDPKYSGKRFSQLDSESKKNVLEYEIVFDLLVDIPDNEIYDIFARLNTYSMTLNAQELRNSQYFGEFKSTVYNVSNEFITFWSTNNIFSEKQILRMGEAEFVSDLLIAMSKGITAKTKVSIDKFYEKHDDEFPKKATLEKNFRNMMDIIGNIFNGTLGKSKFNEPRMFYPLYLAIYHSKYGLPLFEQERFPIRKSDYSKVFTSLGKIDELFERRSLIEEISHRTLSGENIEDLIAEYLPDGYDASDPDFSLDDIAPPLSPSETRFLDAYTVHWVHADKRTIRTEFIYDLIRQYLAE